MGMNMAIYRVVQDGTGKVPINWEVGKRGK